MEEMAADYIDAIRSVQPEGPYQLLGLSTGGVLAYEIAQQIQRLGKQVSLLCLLDTALPETRKKSYTDEEFMRLFARNIGLDDLLGENDVPTHPSELLARAQAVGRLPGIDPGQFERYHAVYKKLGPPLPQLPSSAVERSFRALPRPGTQRRARRSATQLVRTSFAQRHYHRFPLLSL